MTIWTMVLTCPIPVLGTQTTHNVATCSLLMIACKSRLTYASSIGHPTRCASVLSQTTILTLPQTIQVLLQLIIIPLDVAHTYLADIHHVPEHPLCSTIASKPCNFLIA